MGDPVKPINPIVGAPRGRSEPRIHYSRVKTREWLQRCGVLSIIDIPKWALIAHKSGAWQILSRREVRRIANDTDMQEAIVTAWRMNANKGVLGILQSQLWEGSR